MGMAAWLFVFVINLMHLQGNEHHGQNEKQTNHQVISNFKMGGS